LHLLRRKQHVLAIWLTCSPEAGAGTIRAASICQNQVHVHIVTHSAVWLPSDGKFGRTRCASSSRHCETRTWRTRDTVATCFWICNLAVDENVVVNDGNDVAVNVHGKGFEYSRTRIAIHSRALERLQFEGSLHIRCDLHYARPHEVKLSRAEAAQVMWVTHCVTLLCWFAVLAFCRGLARANDLIIIADAILCRWGS